MNDAFAQHLPLVAPFEGALACGLRFADGTSVSRSWSEDFVEASLDNALRCVADLFQVLQLNRIVSGRVRWVFGNALLHCERHADGSCFSVFTARACEPLEQTGLEQLFADFHKIQRVGPVAP